MDRDGKNKIRDPNSGEFLQSDQTENHEAGYSNQPNEDRETEVSAEKDNSDDLNNQTSIYAENPNKLKDSDQKAMKPLVKSENPEPKNPKIQRLFGAIVKDAIKNRQERERFSLIDTGKITVRRDLKTTVESPEPVLPTQTATSTQNKLDSERRDGAVSYTHLTLPTNREV